MIQNIFSLLFIGSQVCRNNKQTNKTETGTIEHFKNNQIFLQEILRDFLNYFLIFFLILSYYVFNT